MLCRDLIGREHELQELHEALQLAATGQPHLVLLAGEAGLGKTRLCRAFMQASHAEQALILFGQAIPQDSALPLGPFLDAFRRYLARAMKALPPTHDPLHAPFTFLLQLFPELTSLYSEAISPSFESGNTSIQNQQSVFYGILSALQMLAHSSQGPLLLVLEDLHWADETSLELLAFLAQRLEVNTADTEVPIPLLIFGTYRSEALPESPALRRLLVQLHSQRHLKEVRLASLSFGEQWRCVNNILGQNVPERFAHFLFDWNEGNPFFIEELLSVMAASEQLQILSQGWLISPGMKLHLPSSLADAILERFVQLPTTDQEVLSYAAVIGRTFSFPLLAALCGIDESELARVLRRTMNMQLISEVSTPSPTNMIHYEQERYQFRHALTREAIYDHMLAFERHLSHRVVAETIEKLTRGDQEGQVSAEGSTRSSGNVAFPVRADQVNRLLAEHYWLAGLPEKARPFALQEAERARRIYAFHEERYYLNMAQSSLPEDSPERLQLLQRMGMLSLGIYDFADALHWLTLAKNGYQRIGQRGQALQVMANLLFANWFLASQSIPDLLAEVESATEDVFADPDPASKDVETLVAASLLAHYWTVHSQKGRSSRWIKRCFDLFESLDDPRKVPAIQLTYITRAWFKAHRYSNDVEEGIVEIRQAIDLASQYSLPDVIMMGYATFAWLLIYWGRSDEAEQVLQEAVELEERSGTLMPAFLLGWLHFFSEEQWELGIGELRLRIERLDLLHVSYVAAAARVALVHLLLAKNEVSEAQRLLQAARPPLESNNEYLYSAPLWWGLAKLYSMQGDLMSAQQWYEHSLKHWKTTEDTLIIMPLLLDGILFYVDIGYLTKAWQWLAELEAVMLTTDNPVGAAALLEAQGVIEAAEERLEQGISKLREAVEAWSRLKWYYKQALAAQRLAQMLLTWATKVPMRSTAQVAREEADRLLDLALVVYERLQIPTGIEAIHSLRIRTRLEAQQKRRSTLKAREAPQGLTERERQVLLQLATGRSNREIASELHISVGTVELHVSHILSKLSCKTRTQAVAYAIARDWVNRQPST